MSTTVTETSGSAITVRPAFDSTIHKQYKYGEYLPVYDETTTLPPLQSFEFNDRGLVANKSKSNLFPKDHPDIKVSQLTPQIGTEVHGLQLSQLKDLQKDELALLIAERGVVVFRNQDFKDIGVEKQKEFGRYFGPLHIHPPGITILTLLSVPPTGGDTIWASQTAAYKRLSTPFKTLLEGLRAEHSGFPQADKANRDGKHVRRQPVKSEHPIVRIHPATGQKALFVQPGFTKRIIGLKQEESDGLLKILFKHIANGQDFQARVRWEEGTVALWDNRVTAHTAVNDYDVHNPQEGLRHGFRITTLADKPKGVAGLESVW
ncbi:hypothetical protein FSARC_1071 [Fusarium sarcochroum]|uniref:TauD/TfdA-like domain-containing protein n=1 Tax=Fusarium sarcochroum TaxID=1208366 RepID=A0A8H4XFM6_9HYPO|nr:hypothetical protein FSARC_1071 [Fusarium sarcochroum]